jgi:hypothetical protein
MEERRPYKAEVGGSSPPVPIYKKRRCCHGKEPCYLGQGGEGSNRAHTYLPCLYQRWSMVGLGYNRLVLIGTAITGFCLLYKVVGFRTG